MNAVPRMAITIRVSPRCPAAAAMTAVDTTVPVMIPSPLIIPSGSRSRSTCGAAWPRSCLAIWRQVNPSLGPPSRCTSCSFGRERVPSHILGSEKIVNNRCGSLGAVGFHRQIIELPVEFVCDRCSDDIRVACGVVHASAGSIAVKSVRHVEGLLEMVSEREVQERLLVGHEFHRGGEPALHDGHVTGRKVPVEVGYEAAHLQP